MNVSRTEERFDRLMRRRAPADILEGTKLSATREALPGVATRYIVNAMKPIAAASTAKLIEQGNRIENQLRKGLSEFYPGLALRRQGSVSNDTHIRFHSDVDVLTIIDKFETLEAPQVPKSPYTGDQVDDLRVLRTRAYDHLVKEFEKANVSNAGSTAISLSGGSLACKVDVVPANWFNTNGYAHHGVEVYRGIQVLVKDTGERPKNFPFWFNYRIEQRDKDKTNRLRQLIRLMKTIKADLAEDGQVVACTSFDLCSVAYRMPDRYYNVVVLDPLGLIDNLIGWLTSLSDDKTLREPLKVVDDSRLIFRSQDQIDGIDLIRRDLEIRLREARRETGMIKLSTALPFGDQQRFYLTG